MAADFVFTVSKLNEYASRVLSSDLRLQSVKVSGEISGFKPNKAGHLYFNLKDEGAVVSCVVFASRAAALKIIPRDGLKVVAQGAVTIYPKSGQYQLRVDSMREEGVGDIYQRFLLLKDKLDKEGVFANHRCLPALPRRIGVVTSPTGAAVRDICSVIKRRYPIMNILLAPCQVQGESAPREIIAAINALQRFSDCDVIIVGRGGGSYEDLDCFNDEGVARAIFTSSIPVVSAVGHETDFTIADFAADLRAPTPSAAAELCCPVYEDMSDEIGSMRSDLRELMEGRLFEARSGLESIVCSAAMANPTHIVRLKREMLEAALNRMTSNAKASFYKSHAMLDTAKGKLKALDPNAVIERGYSVITDSQGRVVNSVSMLNADDEVSIKMIDGFADAVITAVRM